MPMNAGEPFRPASQGALPANLTLASRDGRLEISWRWSPFFVGLLPALCCFGPCGLYGSALVDGTVRHMSNGRFVGYLKLPWLGYPMMAVAMLGSAVLLYLFLASLVNRTVVRAEPGRLRVFHTPLPWPPTSVDLAPEDIVGFEAASGLRVMQGNKHLVKPTDSLVLVDTQGRKRQVATSLESQAQISWVEAQLRQTLGMPASSIGDGSQEAPAPEELSTAPARFTAEVQEPETALPPEEQAPRGMLERLVRGLLAHGLGYAAATQQVYAVGGHFGWLMMSIIGLQEGGSGSAGRTLSSGLLTAYKMLGGVDARGRGGPGEMMEVWGKVALIIYLVELLLSWVRGPRRAWGLKRKWAASSLLACAGYGLAFVLLAGSRAGGSVGDMLVVMLGCVVFTSVMTLWALGVGRFMRFLQQQVRGAPARTEDQRFSS